MGALCCVAIGARVRRTGGTGGGTGGAGALMARRWHYATLNLCHILAHNKQMVSYSFCELPTWLEP